MGFFSIFIKLQVELKSCHETLM